MSMTRKEARLLKPGDRVWLENNKERHAAEVIAPHWEEKRKVIVPIACSSLGRFFIEVTNDEISRREKE